MLAVGKIKVRNLSFVTRLLKSLKENEQGSFTIEATLVFPTIFILTLGLLFFSLYIHLNVYMYYKSSLVAERAAFAWTNSYRDSATGDIEMNGIVQNNDGLYWRTADAMNIGDAKDEKLTHALESVSFVGESEASYHNSLFKRQVWASMSRQITAPVFIEGMYGSDGRSAAANQALVADPVEYIRTFDLIYYYLPGISEKITDSDTVKNIIGSFTDS